MKGVEAEPGGVRADKPGYDLPPGEATSCGATQGLEKSDELGSQNGEHSAANSEGRSTSAFGTSKGEGEAPTRGNTAANEQVSGEQTRDDFQKSSRVRDPEVHETSLTFNFSFFI